MVVVRLTGQTVVNYYQTAPLLIFAAAESFYRMIREFLRNHDKSGAQLDLLKIIISEVAEIDNPRFIAHTINVSPHGTAMNYGSSSSSTLPHRPLSIRQISPHPQIENLSMIVGICRDNKFR